MVRFGLEIASIFSPLYNRDCNYIRSRLLSWLQAYLVPCLTKIASIFGPNLNFHSKHIWSLSLKSLQPYVVLYMQLNFFSLFIDFLKSSPVNKTIGYSRLHSTSYSQINEISPLTRKYYQEHKKWWVSDFYTLQSQYTFIAYLTKSVFFLLFHHFIQI